MQQQPSQSSSQAGGGTQGDTGSELRSDAKQLGRSAADRIHSEVDARKSTAADQASAVSSAIERAAGELDPSSPDWLKSALQQGAQKIQTFADTIQHKDSRELMSEAQGFARNNPGTFLAACAAAGFAAARILKAGGEQSQQSAEPSYPSGRMATPSLPESASARTGEFA